MRGRAKKENHGPPVAGRYRVDSALPSRGLGTAFRCFDLRDQRPLDLLRFPAGTATPSRIDQRLGRLHTLHGPGLARLVDAIAGADAALDLIAEPSYGQTLGERMRDGPLSVAEVVQILDSVLTALDASHALGIPHRDIRPERVRLVEAPGRQPPWVVLHGAGLAWLLSDDSAPSIAGLAYGHPQFTAPEQWVNRRADARTDLYAVGLLGYLMLQGRNLVTSGSAVEACRQHATTARRLIRRSAGGEDIPEPLAEALRVAAAADPYDRHPDASTMRAALLSEAGLLAPTPPPELVPYEVDEASVADLSLNMSIMALEEVAGSLEIPDSTLFEGMDGGDDPDETLED